MNKNYWISWYTPEPLRTFELHSPWWVSGYDADDRTILVAAVRAGSEQGAMDIVKAAFDNPDAEIRWRFCEEQPADWNPFNSRFSQAKWMAWSETATCGCARCGGAAS